MSLRFGTARGAGGKSQAPSERKIQIDKCSKCQNYVAVEDKVELAVNRIRVLSGRQP